MNNNQDFQVFLTARRYLYVLFQSLLGNEPSEDLVLAIDVDFVSEALTEAGIGEANSSSQFLTALGKTSLDNLKSEYTKLYIGPEELKAPPWESVYVSEDGTLFTRDTLAVRKFYRAQGFIPAEYPHVADDHVAIELDFLAKLAARAQDDPDAKVGKEALLASKDFLQDHLLVWAPTYLNGLKETNAKFYPVVVAAMLTFVKNDYENLSAIL